MDDEYVVHIYKGFDSGIKLQNLQEDGVELEKVMSSKLTQAEKEEH